MKISFVCLLFRHRWVRNVWTGSCAVAKGKQVFPPSDQDTSYIHPELVKLIISFFSSISTYKNHAQILLARLYFFVSGVTALMIFSAELIRLIAHFVVKSDFIDDCRSALTGAKAETLNGAITSIDATEASRLCENDWQRGIWWDLGWLVLTSCLALLFTGIVGAYCECALE